MFSNERENNIKVYVKEVEWVAWTCLVRDKNNWRAVVNGVVKFVDL
jgi:hypothetical protein